MVEFITFEENKYRITTAQLNYGGFIQFLPNDPKPYFQYSTNKNDIIIDPSYQVFIESCDLSINQNANSYITLTQFVEDNINRVKITFCSIPFDYKTTPVRLRIESLGNTYYSNHFLITNIGKEYTSRIDYVDGSRNITGGAVTLTGVYYQGIRLRFYLNNEVLATELETYYQISTMQNVNNRIKIKEYLQWKTDIIDAFTYKNLMRAFYTGRCYINFERNYIVEASEYKEREGDSNISVNTFITDPNDKDILTYSDCGGTTPFVASTSTESSTSLLTSNEFE
jgi:hypothetical protein